MSEQFERDDEGAQEIARGEALAQLRAERDKLRHIVENVHNLLATNNYQKMGWIATAQFVGEMEEILEQTGGE